MWKVFGSVIFYFLTGISGDFSLSSIREGERVSFVPEKRVEGM